MAINNIEPFKFWCQKVLPLVYDNSLSYYEVLCKVTNKLNEIIAVDNQQNEAIAKNADDIETLQHDVEVIQGDLQDLSQTVQNHTLELEELGITINILANNFAEEYSSLSTYDIGDVVIEGNHLYVKTANTGDFADDWTQTTVAEIAKAIEGKISTINDRIGALVSSIDSVASQIVAPYDTATSYTAGMYCSYLGDFYVCTDSTSGAFDRSKWDETNVGWELADLRADYNVLSTLLNTVSGRVDTIRAIIAETYDEEMTYNEGDYCTDLGHLYKCNSDNVTGVFDPTKWAVTTVGAELKLAMNSGGGGGGGETVPNWDEYTEYHPFDLVTYNGTLYMLTGSAVIGTFNPTQWTAVPINLMIENNQKVLNGTRASEYDGSAGYSEKEMCVHFDSNNEEYLYYADVDTSGNWDSNDWIETDVVTELIKLARYMWGFGVDTYDSTKTYNEGDLIVNYSGRVQYCKANNVTGTYDISYWEDTNIFNELANIRNRINNLNLYNGNIVDRFSTNVTEGV